MNVDVDVLARLAWGQIWQVAIVALAVGALAGAFCRDRPAMAYALWMLVVVKSVTPPILSSPTSPFSWIQASRTSTLRDADARPSWASSPGIDADENPAERESQVGAAGPEPGARARVGWLLAAWPIGTMIGSAYVAVSYWSCLKVLLRSSVPTDDSHAAMLRDLVAKLGIRGDVRLITTSRPIGPAVFGSLRPSILLPVPVLGEARPEEVELILAHELIHIRRGDVLAGKLQLASMLVWWFNPLLWWANREASRARERCCDEDVVSRVGCTPGLYARTLLRVLEQKGRLRSPISFPGVRAMEVTATRLESIMRSAKGGGRPSRRGPWAAFAAGAVVCLPGAGMPLDVGARPVDLEASTAAAAEIARMQGAWRVVHHEYSGKVETEVKGLLNSIEKDRWHRPNRRTSEYQLQVDPGREPKRVDLSAKRLGHGTLKGIYRLEGDRLFLCYAYGPELPRPTEFRTTEGDAIYLYILERAEPATPAPPPPAESGRRRGRIRRLPPDSRQA
ncbi:M56 family metallopeptidase [Singulisphaera sp. PoT]|uniref:M56 family metallopeptidase n=1 Tax=Singulisphaera sp. PoT TaxID=3411797 RepID=UPI003BF5E39E